jgi:integrase
VQNGIIAKAGPAASPPHLHPLAVAEQCAYTKPEDWVFASKQYGGRRPYGEHPILRRYIRPVAQRVGFQKRFGWRTFRHYTRLCCEVSGPNSR